MRGAHLDATHGFFNGTSVFLRVLGQEDALCRVTIQPPRAKNAPIGGVATALEPRAAKRRRQGAWLRRLRGKLRRTDRPPGRKWARSRSPASLACGVPHEIAITGRHD